MIQYLRRHHIHLFLIPTLFVLKHFFAIVTPMEVANDNSPLYKTVIGVISVLSCSLIPFLVFWILKQLKFTSVKSSIIASFLCCLFFFTSEVFNHFIDPVFEGTIRIRWFLIVSLILLTVFSFVVYRSKRSFVFVNEFLNLLMLILIAYVGGTLIFSYNQLRPKRIFQFNQHFELRDSIKSNVYFFLLDSYTSNKSLRNYFGFNNAPFVQALRDKGFQVEDESYSNYDQTVYSLAYTLNPEYSVDLTPYFAEDVKRVIFNSAVVNSFYKRGYSIRNYSWLDLADAPKFYSFSKEFRPYFLTGILQNTILRWWFEGQDTFDEHLKILKEVAMQAATPKGSPSFFYVHILAPHPPFVMGPDGLRLNGIQQSGMTRYKAYINQLEGVNKLITQTISEILKRDAEATIVIQGDHGSRLLPGNLKEKEAHTVFLAFLCKRKDKIPAPINSHKIFKHLFGI